MTVFQELDFMIYNKRKTTHSSNLNILGTAGKFKQIVWLGKRFITGKPVMTLSIAILALIVNVKYLKFQTPENLL